MRHDAAELQEERKADGGNVLEAVQQHGRASQHDAAGLQADRELVLEAARQDGTALHSVAELMADREPVLEAVRKVDVHCNMPRQGSRWTASSS